MTEETQPSTESQASTQQADKNVPTTVTTEVTRTKEGKKDKCRPMTKVVIRRLPPTMTQEQFLEQVSPLPDYDYMYFAKADMSLGQYAFSRAYIDFTNQKEIFSFREKFDNYVFVDSKGTEFPAVVEYAPFQRVPKKRTGKKKDLKCGTIESDPYYISFLESLKSQETDGSNAQPKTEYSFQPSDHAPKKVTTTPLLDFLKQRKQEKQRVRDEKREEKRRRDIERKRVKDEPVVSKVLKCIEERDVNRENKENKDDKDRGSHNKEVKNRNKKEDRYKEKMNRDRDSKVAAKSYRDKDDKSKEKDVKQSKKHEDKKYHNKKEDRDANVKDDRVREKEEVSNKDKKAEEKRGKSYEKMRLEKKRQAEIQKKQAELALLEADGNINESKEDESCTNLAGKNSNEGKAKMKNKKSADVEADKQGDESSVYSQLQEVCDRLASSSLGEEKTVEQEFAEKKSPAKSRIAKRRSSLESGGDAGTSGKGCGGGGCSGGNDGGKRGRDGAKLRRHKSLDGGNDSNLQKNECDDKEKDKKDPRTERRIRNKDRPAMEIYRPGMGKFSKQRMEREKGSERAEERVTTPSQSPTPPPGNSKSAKPSGSEVRSMTFKRSVSRDMS